MMTISNEPAALVATLTAALGLSHQELVQRAKLAGWPPARFADELATPGWEGRFRAAVEAAVANASEEALTRLLRHGAASLASKSQLLAAVPDRRLQNFAREYDPQAHGGRIIAGPTGIGKTLGCVALLRRMVEWQILTRGARAWTSLGFDFAIGKVAPHPFRWVRAYDLPNARLEHGFGEGEAELVSEASKAEFLILDDLGWESRRAGADDVVMEVLAARYDAGLVTVATTGLRVSELSERYGDAVVRRIVESGGKPGRVLDLWPQQERQ
jgi:hypothetical protein